MDNKQFSWGTLDDEAYVKYAIDDEGKTEEGTESQIKSYYMNRHGSIKSPNYPLNYPEESNFKYTIILHSAASVLLVLEDFNVEASSTCAYDAVNIEAENCARVSYIWLLSSCRRAGSTGRGEIFETFLMSVVLSQSFCKKHFVALDMKGCICHFAKWQIHPFISKGKNCQWPTLPSPHVVPDSNCGQL